MAKSNVKWSKIDISKLTPAQAALNKKVETAKKAYQETEAYKAYIAANKELATLIEADFSKVLPAGKVAQVATRYGLAVRIVDKATTASTSLSDMLAALKVAA